MSDYGITPCASCAYMVMGNNGFPYCGVKGVEMLEPRSSQCGWHITPEEYKKNVKRNS